MINEIVMFISMCILCYLIGHVVGYEKCHANFTQHTSFNKTTKYPEASKTQARPDGATVEQPSKEKIYK